MSIDKNILRQMIVERIDFAKRIRLVKRDIELEPGFPVVLTGIRRCGKSYLLYQTMHQLIDDGHDWDEFLYINFEDERLIGFTVQDFNTLIEVYYSLSHKEPILFLDEIQNIDSWERFARRIADEKRQVYITGSNASMLSREIESTLGGRYLAKSVYPYSFKEFLKAKDVAWDQRSTYSTQTKGQLVGNFDEFMRFGGFPEVLNRVNKRDYLSSIYNRIYLGDVIVRHNLSNTKALEILMKKLAESVRQPISYTRLANILKSIGITISKTTLIQYMEYLMDAHLIYNISNYATSIVNRTTTPKYYFVDTGILNLFLYDADPALLENIVAIALIRQYQQENVTFYQDSKCEVDFYVPDANLAIQVCYSLSDEETRKREVSALKRFNQFNPTATNLILTYEGKSETLVDEDINIEIMPVYQWLMEQ